MRSSPKLPSNSIRLRRDSSARLSVSDDVALTLSLDRRMRFLDEAFHPFRQPVIATRLLATAIHALVHDSPAPFIADDEAMQIKVETVLNGGAVNFGDQSTGFC